MDRLQVEICENVFCRTFNKNDTTSSPHNNNRLINLPPYLHQFDKNEDKIKKKIVKLKRANLDKQYKKSDEYSEEKYVDKLIRHEENILHRKDSDDILVAKNKYIKLKITA